LGYEPRARGSLVTGIFLSYRRDDSQGEALHLFDDLRKHFGQDQVFMDVTGIDPGRDFRKAIDGAVGSCEVLIVMIGKKWLDGTDERGRRRLDDPEDFVRMETAAALRREIPVIPVLVQGTVMPRSDQLPGALEALAWRNAFEVRHARWEIDVAELLKALKKVVRAPETRGKPEAPEDKRSGLPIPKWAALAVGGALVGVVVYALLPGLRPQAPSDSRPSTSRMSQMEYGTNRFGGDYKSIEASEPQACQDTCARETQCVAFTFVKPGVQGATGVCWLKDRVSPPNPDPNCVSGIKR
jgi:hypothetical protein